MLHAYYDFVCAGTGTIQRLEDGKEQRVVVLSFPKDELERPEDPQHDDNYTDVALPVAAAKSLLVDVRDAVDAVIDRKPLEISLLGEESATDYMGRLSEEAGERGQGELAGVFAIIGHELERWGSVVNCDEGDAAAMKHAILVLVDRIKREIAD